MRPDPRLLHPVLREALPGVCAVLVTPTRSVQFICGYRSLQEQAARYAQGRALDAKGRWRIVDRAAVVTNASGLGTPSRHNYLPALAFDLAVFDAATGAYLPEDPIYDRIGGVVEPLGLEWGGRWRTLRDRPHVQILVGDLHGRSAAREATVCWQRLLGVTADGAWGPVSRAALLARTGIEERTVASWLTLLASAT